MSPSSTGPDNQTAADPSTDLRQEKLQSNRSVAAVLNEALPYIQRFSGSTVVVKYGGNAMTEEALKKSFARNIVLMKQVGLNPVVVHGGGPQIGAMLEQVGKQSHFINGMRYTDSETMDIVEMVLGGHVNKSIVSMLNLAGGNSIGLTGKDGGLITAKPLKSPDQDDSDDLGQVGQVDSIDASIIETLQQNNIIPVIAPVGIGADGLTYNINADLVASSVAAALNATRFLLLTNTPGILDKEGQLLTGLDRAEIDQLIGDGTIAGGMLPKVQCALDAIDGGVESVQIIDGRIEHALLLELFTDQGLGTLIHH